MTFVSSTYIVAFVSLTFVSRGRVRLRDVCVCLRHLYTYVCYYPLLYRVSVCACVTLAFACVTYIVGNVPPHIYVRL